MVEKTVTISNPTGLHARPASLFIQKANSFQSTIKITKGEKVVDAKSLLGLMSLAVKQNEQITLQAEGEDAKEAVESLAEFVENLKE